MELVPAPDYRRVFKRGMSGTDVAGLQINLGILVDGIFAGETHSAVSAFQAGNGLVVDGIAGTATQRALVKVKSGPYQKQFALPGGILISIVSNESGFAVSAYGPGAGDSYDLGAYQRHLRSPEQHEIRDAYRIDTQARLTAETLRRLRDEFMPPVASWYVANIADDDKGRMAWQLAVLAHNWPEAAENIAAQGTIHDDPREDTADSDWVIYFSGGRLRSDREWVVSYIERATVFVTWPQLKGT